MLALEHALVQDAGAAWKGVHALSYPMYGILDVTDLKDAVGLRTVLLFYV